MRHMPAIPESTRSSIILRLLDHAEHNWPQLAKVRARYHGSFAYITGVLRNGEQIPLFRLRYGGSAHSFGFAIYSAARARYEDAVLLTGSPVGTPQQALDTACTVHLAGLGHEPPTNLRCHPLKRTHLVRPPSLNQANRARSVAVAARRSKNEPTGLSYRRLSPRLLLGARAQLAPHVLVRDLAPQHRAEVLEAQTERPADERVDRPEEAVSVQRPYEHEHCVHHQVGGDLGLEVAPALQLRRRLQVAVVIGVQPLITASSGAVT